MLSTTFILAPLVAALSVMTPPVPALLAESAADTAEVSQRVHITVDIAQLGPRGDGVDGLVIEELTPKLEQAGFEVVDDHEAAVTLHIRFEALREGKFDFGIHFEFVDGDRVDPATEWVACLSCADANLLPALDQLAPTLIEALEKHLAAPASNPNGIPSENGHDDPPVGPKPKPIGPLGISGAVGLAVGIGLSVGGGIVLANPKQEITQSYEPFGVERDRTSLGVALLVPGATLVVAGTVMLAVDIAKRAKQRRLSENVTVVPTVSPFGVGVGVAGQF